MQKLLTELQMYIDQAGLQMEGGNKLTATAPVGTAAIYPFTQVEGILTYLVARGVMSYDQYLEMRDAYMARNQYLSLYEITAPRSFGETWAEEHLRSIVPELKKANIAVDPDFCGQYDFWYEGIKIEVKASRAVSRGGGGTLASKALASDTKQAFDMNFQQLKPASCDVFVWIAVWRDAIWYWVMSSEEVTANKYYNPKQHRGNVGEGQLWIKRSNIEEFHQYRVGPNDILSKIIEKASQSIAAPTA